MSKHKHYQKSYQSEERQIAKALEKAIHPLDLLKVNEMLATKPNINNMLGYADDPIFIAAVKTGSFELVKLFINYAKYNPDKASINVKDKYGGTALLEICMSTVNAKHTAQMAQFLIDGGADPTISTHNGYTALHAAVERHKVAVVKILLENAADPNAIYKKDPAEDMENIAPIHYAALERHIEMTELLVSYGANLDLTTQFIDSSGRDTTRDIYASDDSSAEEFDQAVAKGLASRAAMLLLKDTTSEDTASYGVTSEDTICNTKKHARENDDQSHNDGEALSKSAKHSHVADSDTSGANHHSNSVNSDDNDDSSKIEKTKHEAVIEASSSLSELTLKNLYAWIYEFPEWMQNQLLNSSPIKELIESVKQNSAIYDIKSIGQDFAIKILIHESSKNPVDMIEHDIYEKIQVVDLRPVDAIDMTMIKGPTVNKWILPMIESRNMFAGDVQAHGHEIDVF